MKIAAQRTARLGLAIVAALCATLANARDFRSAEVHPNDYPTTLAVQHMGKLVAERSKGRMGVKVYPSGALGSEKDNIEQLRLGALDMMRINVAPLNAVVPETIATGLPFVFRSTEHMRKVLDGPVGDDILKSMESQGLVGLAFYDSGARSFYTVKKPIRTIADMKGLKIRVIQSDLFVAMVEALGANPTPMPYGEVYTALKTGIVDAAENNWPSYESSRHFEAAKYYNLSEHSLAPEVLVFSKKVWDTLPPADQALLRQAAKDSVPYMRKLWDEREVKSRQVVEKAGIQTVQLANKKEFVDAMGPVYAKFAATPRLKDLVKRIQDTQ
jgi:tripartite ATP-independent transporter DctP family solute receptor